MMFVGIDKVDKYILSSLRGLWTIFATHWLASMLLTVLYVDEGYDLYQTLSIWAIVYSWTIFFLVTRDWKHYIR